MVAIENEAPVNRRSTLPLSRGLVFIQYRTENLA